MRVKGTRRGSIAVIALLAAAALALALASGAEAAKPVHVSCGETITADTKLANDLIDCPEHGIVIGADDITLDLNGHTIDGAAACPDIEAFCAAGVLNQFDDEPGHSGVTVENGSIQEFSIGVLVVRADNNQLQNLATSSNTSQGLAVVESEHAKVERNTSAGECFGITVAAARDVRVARNSVSDHTCAAIGVFGSDHVQVADNAVSQTREGNDTAGIYVVEHSDHNRIERNSVSGNGFVGLIIGDADDNKVTGNRIFKNTDGMIVAGDASTISENRITDAVGNDDGSGYGIVLEAGRNNLLERNVIERTLQSGIRVGIDPETPPQVSNVVRLNLVRDTGLDGIFIDALASDTLLDRNRAEGAGDDGIGVGSTSTTLTGNTANANHDLGIEAVAGVTDGGGNKAAGNGNALQCTNVFCK